MSLLALYVTSSVVLVVSPVCSEVLSEGRRSAVLALGKYTWQRLAKKHGSILLTETRLYSSNNQRDGCPLSPGKVGKDF